MNNILCITGMHRSGTSLTANWLETCGLVLLNKLEGDFGNKQGHFEDKDFVFFHENLINERIPFDMAKGWKVTHQIDPKFTFHEKSNAIALIKKKQKFTSGKIWGWKDPRTSLFLQDWKEIVPKLKVIILWRPCIEVVLSLLNRSIKSNKTDIKKINFIDSVKLWKIYNLNIIKYILKNRENVILVNINDVIQKDRPLLNFIMNKFNLNLIYNPIIFVYNQTLMKSDSNSSTVFNLKYKLAHKLYNINNIEQTLKDYSLNL